jgi:hypothetical protein
MLFIIMNNILDYIHEEISFYSSKRELNYNHIDKIRFMYFFAVIFIVLLILKFLNLL